MMRLGALTTFPLKLKPFLSLQLTAVLIMLGLATSIALTVWASKNREGQMNLVSLRLLVAIKIQEDTDGAIILFYTGQKGRLPRNHKDYQSHIALAKRSQEGQYPIGVSIDNVGEIGEIARADNDFVQFLAEGDEDKVKVWFQGHDGIASLSRQHPRFEDIKRELNRSLKEKKRIWFVWRGLGRKLEDAMIFEEDDKAKKLT